MRARMAAAMMLLFLSLCGGCPRCFGQQTSQQAPASGAIRAKPDSLGRYHPGNGVTTPKVIFSVDPQFTDEARKKKLNGTAVLSLTVGTDGIPSDITIVRSIADGLPERLRSAAHGLDANAVKAAEQYRFKPATLEGKPVPILINIEMNFQLF